MKKDTRGARPETASDKTPKAQKWEPISRYIYRESAQRKMKNRIKITTLTIQRPLRIPCGKHGIQTRQKFVNDSKEELEKENEREIE